MANTFTYTEAQDAIYEQLRASASTKASNRVYPLSLVKQSINDAHKRVLNKRNYPFLVETVPFNTSIDTTVATAISIGDTTIELTNASGLKTSGIIVINENVISYTGVTTNTLTGVTGIASSHAAGATCKQLYNLETDLGITNYKKCVSIIIDEQEYNHYNYRGTQAPQGYTEYNGNLYLPEQTSQSKIVVFKYRKAIPALTDDTDTFLIPDDYVTCVVEYGLYKCHRNVDDNRAIEALNEYNRIRMEMEADFAKETDNKYPRVKSIYEPNKTFNA